MKQIILFFTLLLLLSSCGKRTTAITGQFAGNASFLLYTNAENGTIYSGFNDTLKLTESGEFELQLKLKQPTFISIWNPNPHKQVKLLLIPGSDNHISILPDDILISGANEKGQMLYQTFPNPSFIELQARPFFRETPEDTHDKLELLKQDELARMENLLQNKDISKEFYNTIKTDRDCYYASLEARLLQIKTYRLLTDDPEGKKKEYLERLGEIYAAYPPEDKKMVSSSFWSEYAAFYVRDYLQFIKEDFDIQMFRNLIANDSLNTYLIDEAKKHLKGDALEFYRATHIYFTAIQQDFEKELIVLFEQFEKDYPRSTYSVYIKPHIEKIREYYRMIESDFKSDMKLMDNYSNINTLQEAIEPLKGKKIYIDVWATWCGPCKKEFEHNETLKKYLAENDIQMLYISVDDDRNQAKWLEAIKYYNLTGTHIRANDTLADNLRRWYDEKSADPYIMIPWYIMVDEEGNVIEKHAQSPSEIIN